MRPTSLLTAQGNFFIAQSRSVAAVNRRQTSGNKALAHQFQFFRRFPAFINPSLRLQLFDLVGNDGLRQTELGDAVDQNGDSRRESSYSLLERSLSVSSMRSIKQPPSFLARSQLNSAVRVLPMCIWPVGLGANLTLMLFIVKKIHYGFAKL